MKYLVDTSLPHPSSPALASKPAAQCVSQMSKPFPTKAETATVAPSLPQTLSTGKAASPLQPPLKQVPYGWEAVAAEPLAIALVFGVVGLVIMRGSIIEHVALGLHGSSLTALRTREYLADARADYERKRYISMSNKRFDALLDDLLKLSAEEKRAADILLGQAARLGAGRWLADKLQARGALRMRNHLDLLAKYARLQAMREDLDLNRDVLMHKRKRQLILKMMDQLDQAYDSTARAALAKLNELATQFEWETLPPPHLPVNVRLQLAKFLRLMAGTDILEEARAAKAKFLNLLQKHDSGFVDIGV